MGIRIRRVLAHPSLLAALTAVGLMVLASSPKGMADAKSPTPLLVELFTSEGCSSCPPVGAFLRELDSKQPLPGAQFIVLEEHVDYWDGDGWRDPFSSHDMTLRQAQYAERLHVATGSYTPQMVVDGAYEFVGNDLARANQAFQKALALPTVPVRISSATAENGKLHVHVESDLVPAKADVWLALALDHAESQVLRGENGGHHLEHVAVAKRLSKIGKAEKGSTFSKDVTLDSVAKPSRVIIFLQEPGQGKIIGAAMKQFQP